MDNVTHSLIGIALGCAAEREPGPEHRRARARAVLTAVVASNLADIDVLARVFYPGEPLGALLHHRGYTHTLVAVRLVAAISVWVGRRFFPAPPAANKDAPRGRARLWGLALLAALLHIGADFWNDYGVHPFSPFLNRWFYGDFLFIIEPLLWLSILPLVFSAFSGRLSKAAAPLLAVLLIAAAVQVSPMPGIWMGSWLLAFGAGSVFLQWRFGRGRAQAAPALILVVATLASFFTASRIARQEMLGTLARQAPGERILQLASSPYPANPFLWRFIVVSEDAAGTYRARRANLSLAPQLLPPPEDFLRSQRHAAPLSAATLSAPPGIRWLGEFTGRMGDLSRLQVENCSVRDLLRFARAPFWMMRDGYVVAGDLRYDRGNGRSFAQADGVSGGPCPNYHAPWVPPVAPASLK